MENKATYQPKLDVNGFTYDTTYQKFVVSKLDCNYLNQLQRYFFDSQYFRSLERGDDLVNSVKSCMQIYQPLTGKNAPFVKRLENGIVEKLQRGDSKVSKCKYKTPFGFIVVADFLTTKYRSGITKLISSIDKIGQGLSYQVQFM